MIDRNKLSVCLCQSVCPRLQDVGVLVYGSCMMLVSVRCPLRPGWAWSPTPTGWCVCDWLHDLLCCGCMAIWIQVKSATSRLGVFWPIVAVFYVVAELTNGFVADLTAVVAELTAVVAELDVADSTCRRVGCRRVDLSPTWPDTGYLLYIMCRWC